MRWLEEQGHKRILLVAGESYPKEGFDYVLKSIETVYATSSGPGEIRRVNVNVAPLTREEFVRLKDAKIGTYQLFQETYHRETYGKVHVAGKKADFDWRLTAMDRAMEAGIDDVGIGALFGLFDWRFELLALMQHVEHLETAFGVGPHTISRPAPRARDRLRPRRAPHAPRLRRRLPEARRDPPPRRPLHGAHPLDARDGRDAPGDLRPRHLADLGRQPDEPGRLRRRPGRAPTPGSSRSATTARSTR